MRIIGDVHQEYKHYLRIIDGATYSLQLGDLGFNYTRLKGLDISRHRAIRGNHDNYRTSHPIFLGSYGTYTAETKTIFYVGGAWSIDKQYRTPGINWFLDEELSPSSLAEATKLYGELKPSMVVSHDCPLAIVQYVADPQFSASPIETRTNKALQAMLDIHCPDLWIFGHYHTRKTIKHKGTTFECLDMVRRGSDNSAAFIDI